MAVRGRIRDIVAISQLIENSCAKTNSFIAEINAVCSQIKGAISEQSAGSSQILESLTTINQITGQVGEGAKKIKLESDDSLGAVNKVADMSSLMDKKLADIVGKAVEVSEFSRLAHGMVVQNNQGLASLQAAISRFTIRE
jgi:methyl-accepting chemotaxis protein